MSRQANQNDLTFAEAWIKQVADPYGVLTEGHRLVVEAATWQVAAGGAVGEHRPAVTAVGALP